MKSHFFPRPKVDKPIQPIPLVGNSSYIIDPSTLWIMSWSYKSLTAEDR